MQSVKADPATSGLKFTNTDNSPVDANSLPSNTSLNLHLGFQNNSDNEVPPLAAYLNIGLGMGLTAFDNQDAGHSEFLHHYYRKLSGKQAQCSAVFTGSLPANFDGEIVIKVVTGSPQTSTAVVNFLIYNQNPDIILADNVPSNNSAAIQYTIK